MTAHNDSHARRSNGPRRRANHERINWAKRELGPSVARVAQLERFDRARKARDMKAVQRILREPIAE